MTTFDKDTLKEDLRTKILVVEFEKADGTQRVMRCTLIPKYLPPIVEAVEGDPPKKARQKNDSVIAVWDLDKQGWRSFHITQVSKVTPEEIVNVV